MTTVCGLWMTSGWHHVDVTVVAMAGVGVLLVTDALSWDRVVGEQGAWDVFVWYGGLASAPIVFGEGYVGFGAWWRVGLLAALANLAIWLTIGFGWWKLLGFW
jgi:di/tricarboxylate transporter